MVEYKNQKKGQIGIFILIVLVIFLFIGLMVASPFLGLWYRSYFEPKHKEIDREVWEQTPSRIHGAVQEIAKRQIEYIAADDQERQAICSFLRNSYPNLDPMNIHDSKLRQFFTNCKYGVN